MPGVSEWSGASAGNGGKRREFSDQSVVHAFDEVIPLLIEPVYFALSLDDVFRWQVIAAGYILLVPNEEIPQVVLLHRPQETSRPRSRRFLMPADNPFHLTGHERSGEGDGHGHG